MFQPDFKMQRINNKFMPVVTAAELEKMAEADGGSFYDYEEMIEAINQLIAYNVNSDQTMPQYIAFDLTDEVEMANDDSLMPVSKLYDCATAMHADGSLEEVSWEARLRFELSVNSSENHGPTLVYLIVRRCSDES